MVYMWPSRDLYRGIDSYTRLFYRALQSCMREREREIHIYIYMLTPPPPSIQIYKCDLSKWRGGGGNKEMVEFWAI